MYQLKLWQNKPRTYYDYKQGVISLPILGQGKTDTISQTTCSNAFSWMKMYECQLQYNWIWFLRVQLTIFQHWFRQQIIIWINDGWVGCWYIYASAGLNEVKVWCYPYRNLGNFTSNDVTPGLDLKWSCTTFPISSHLFPILQVLNHLEM